MSVAPGDINLDGEVDDRDGEAFETLFALGQGLYGDGDRRADINGDGCISEKESLEFYTWYDPGQYHKSSGTRSCRRLVSHRTVATTTPRAVTPPA